MQDLTLAPQERLSDIRELLEPDVYLLALPEDDLITFDTTLFDGFEYTAIQQALQGHIAKYRRRRRVVADVDGVHDRAGTRALGPPVSVPR